MNPDFAETRATEPEHFGYEPEPELSKVELGIVDRALNAYSEELSEKIDRLINGGNEEDAKPLLLEHWKVCRLSGKIGPLTD